MRTDREWLLDALMVDLRYHLTRDNLKMIELITKAIELVEAAPDNLIVITDSEVKDVCYNAIYTERLLQELAVSMTGRFKEVEKLRKLEDSLKL